jgi:hypothetical protein
MVSTVVMIARRTIVVIVAVGGAALLRRSPGRSIRVTLWKEWGRLNMGGRLRGRHRLLDDLVELAAIQPNASTLRAVIDLNSVALAHHEIHSARRAEQPGSLGVFHVRLLP